MATIIQPATISPNATGNTPTKGILFAKRVVELASPITEAL